MLAAAIGIHRTVETDVRRLVAGDHRLRPLGTHLGGATGRRLGLKPAIVLGLAAGRGKTIMRIAGGAAAARRRCRVMSRTLNCIYIQYFKSPAHARAARSSSINGISGSARLIPCNLQSFPSDWLCSRPARHLYRQPSPVVSQRHLHQPVGCLGSKANHAQGAERIERELGTTATRRWEQH